MPATVIKVTRKINTMKCSFRFKFKTSAIWCETVVAIVVNLCLVVVLVYGDGQKTSDSLIVNHGHHQHHQHHHHQPPVAPYDITITRHNRPILVRPVTSISGITYRYQDIDSNSNTGRHRYEDFLESFGEATTGDRRIHPGPTRVQSNPMVVVSAPTSTHRDHGQLPPRLVDHQYGNRYRVTGGAPVLPEHHHYTGIRNDTDGGVVHHHHRHGDYPRDHIINVNEVETISRGTFRHDDGFNRTAAIPAGSTHRTYDGPGILGPHDRLVEHRHHQTGNGSSRIQTGTAHHQASVTGGGGSVVYGLRPDTVIVSHRDQGASTSGGGSGVVIESLSRGGSTSITSGDHSHGGLQDRVGMSTIGREHARYGTTYAMDSSLSANRSDSVRGTLQGPTTALINRIHTVGGGGGTQDRVAVTSIGRQEQTGRPGSISSTYVVDTAGGQVDHRIGAGRNQTRFGSADSTAIRTTGGQSVTRIQGGGGQVDHRIGSTGSGSQSVTRIQDNLVSGAIQGLNRPIYGESTGTAHHIDVADRVEVETFNRTSSVTRPSGQLIKPITLTNDEIEAENRARIFAEQQNEEEAKKHAQNVVRLAATDQLNSEIITNRTRAYLSCESGEMIVKINFTEPFRGVGYADYDRTSPCKFYGNGSRYYEMRLPLKGCGTKQEAPRIFLNNIIIRFHRSLELEEDEIKTIICRYPPPLAPPPPLIAAPILEQPPPAAPFIPAKLSEVELLLIVSALLFLTLLLLGIGIGYYCLKKRKVNVVRKFVPPEIPYFPPPSISSEERSIISETSIIHRDDYQYQNLGYLPETKHGYLDDMFYREEHLMDDDVLLTQQNVVVPPVPVYSTKKFDDRFVTQASETDAETDQEVARMIVPKKPKITTLITEDYFVTPKTTTEIIDEVTTRRVVVPPERPLTIKRVDDTLITPLVETEVDDEETRQRMFGPQPPKVPTAKLVDDLYVHSESETELVDDVTRHRIISPPGIKPNKVVDTVKQDDYHQTNVYEIDEIIDDRETRIFQPPGPAPTKTTTTTEDETLVTRTLEVDEKLIEDTGHRVLQPVDKKPKITVQNIDDFYITNITETETNEQTTKIGRSMPNLTLEVDYEEHEVLEDSTTLTGFDVRMRTIPRKPLRREPPAPETTTATTTAYTSDTTTTTSTTKIDEVLRIIENPPREKLPDLDDHFMLPTRNRLRQIILTDEVFRTLVIESTTVEEYYERIQRHPSYGPLFEPPTWNVIFRLLSLPEVTDAGKRKPNNRGRHDTFRSGVSAQEVRSVTEEDVTFSRRVTTGGRPHRVPLPDYPMDDDDDEMMPGSRMSGKKHQSPTGPHWASYLPDPRPYDRTSDRAAPTITPAFATTRRRRYPEYSTRMSSSPPTPSTSVFGSRRLENPYDHLAQSPAARRRLFDYDLRPYSPDLDALSLEPSQSYLNYSGSIRRRNQISTAISEEREEIKSTTETNVYDWKRYG